MAEKENYLHNIKDILNDINGANNEAQRRESSSSTPRGRENRPAGTVNPGSQRPVRPYYADQRDDAGYGEIQGQKPVRTRRDNDVPEVFRNSMNASKVRRANVDAVLRQNGVSEQSLRRGREKEPSEAQARPYAARVKRETTAGRVGFDEGTASYEEQMARIKREALARRAAQAKGKIPPERSKVQRQATDATDNTVRVQAAQGQTESAIRDNVRHSSPRQEPETDLRNMSGQYYDAQIITRGKQQQLENETTTNTQSGPQSASAGSPELQGGGFWHNLMGFIKKVKRPRFKNPPAIKDMLVFAGGAVVLVLLVFGILVLTGYRYQREVLADGTTVSFSGWTSGGVATSGSIGYSNGLTAKIKDGSIVYSDGSVFTGELKGFLPNGYGEMIYGSGSEYRGEFLNGLADGEGTFKASDCEYTGGFSKGEESGYGEKVYSGGTVFKGNFENGEMNGTGSVLYASGDSYDGEFADGMIHGSGTYRWANGDVYVGEFQNGELHGKGTITFSSGRVISGNFENGRFVPSDTDNNNSDGNGAADTDAPGSNGGVVINPDALG